MKRVARKRAGVVAVLVAGLWGLPLTALADLQIGNELTYTADVEEGYLHVDHALTMTNTTPNSRQGNQIIQYYYDSIAFYVPDTVENFTATRDGRELSFTLEPPEEEEEVEGLLVAEVRFGRNIFYRQSVDVLVSYDLPGDPPRSESAFRINPSYISFPVLAWGDPGRVTVKIVTPSVFGVETFGAEQTSAENTGTESVITFADLADPEEFFVIVAGKNDDGLVSKTVEVEGFDVVVRSWPEDSEWRADVSETVREGLPVLQGLVGLPWTTDTPLLITESLEVAIAGYGGWYLEDLDAIELSEWHDPQLVLHELSHAWFDGEMFVERWITEGLAEEYSTAAAVETGLIVESDFRQTSGPLRGSNTTLNEWVLPVDAFGTTATEEEVAAYEEYGYSASAWVIQEITEEIGHEAMSNVIVEASSGHTAYRGVGEPETLDRDSDWRLFLDLLEEVAESTESLALFQRYVTDDELTDRTAARESYAELVDQADGWHQPLYVREAMAEWEFEEADLRIAEALGVLQTRDEMRANLQILDVDPVSDLKDAYETSAENMTVAQEVAETYLSASEDVVDAKESADRERSILESIGLIGEDVDLEYQQAVDALESGEFGEASTEASEVVTILGESGDVGRNRAAWGGSVILVLGGAGAFLVVRRRRRGDDGEVDPLGAD